MAKINITDCNLRCGIEDTCNLNLYVNQFCSVPASSQFMEEITHLGLFCCSDRLLELKVSN